MAGWLTRATEGFRKPPPAPEPYNVACDCGTILTGVRASSAQRPACPDCGRPVFILPLNVYPVSAKPARHDKPALAAPAKKGHGRDAKGTATSNKPERNAVTASSDSSTADARTLTEVRSPWITPFRLVVAAIVVIGGLTGLGLWHRSRLAEARAIVLPAKEAGLKAIQEADFPVAARELTRARRAVDLLGRTDEEANLIRRFCGEAVAGHELSNTGLFELLAESVRDNGQRRALDARHRGSWLLFDSMVLLPEGSRQACVLDSPIEVSGKKFRIEITSPQIRKAVERPGAGNQGRVIFAAQPLQIAPDADDSTRLVLTLNGGTAVIWSNFDTFAALGYRENDAIELQATRDLLTRQAGQLGGAK